MASIILRLSKGSPLTNAEVDDNFSGLNTDVGSRLLASSNLSDLPNTATARTNLGLGSVENKSSATIRGELTSLNVTTALGYTPYNSSNPSGYITSSALSSYLPLSGGSVSYIGINNASAINLKGAGSGTYNTSWIFSDTTITSWEAPLTTDASGGVKVPLILTWRGGYASQGGLRLTGGSSGELGGNQVLHAGNYSSYALPLSGGTVSGQTRFTGNDNQVIIDGTVSSLAAGLFFAQSGTNKWENYHYSGRLRWYNYTTASEEFGIDNASGVANFRVTPTVATNTVLHAGNYNSYSPTLTGGGASGTWGISITGSAGSAPANGGTATALNSSNYISRTGSSGNLNTDFNNTPAGTQRYQGDDSTLTNSPGGTWWIYEQKRHINSSNYWGTQVAWGWEDNANKLAQRNVSGGNWSGWVYYLNSGNYTSYSPSLTGSGASGTWGISVTGSAGSIVNNTSPKFRVITFTGEGGDSGNGSQPTGYGIYQQGGAWTHPYPDLCIGFHTGIKIGAYYGYNGTRFYNNSDWATEIFSVGNGDNNIRAADTIYAAHYRGNANVGGTGEASHHPAGIYSNGTNWLYGTIYTNGNGIYAGGAYSEVTAYRANRANGNFYIDDNYGCGIVGAYASTRYQGVFFMGDSYKMSSDGTSLANMYGMAWSHPNAGGAAGNLTDHGLLIINNGGFRCAISNSIVASANITAYSDERLKKNWRSMPGNYVARLAQVKVGIYDRIDEDDVTQVGVSAQSFRDLLPSAIMTAKDDMGTLSVSYGNAALASAVELAKDNVELRARIERLESIINKLLGDQP